MALEENQNQLLTDLQNIRDALNDLGDALQTAIVQAISTKETAVIAASDVKNLHARLEGLSSVLVKKGVATVEEIRQVTVENNIQTLVEQLNFMKNEGMVEEGSEIVIDSFLVAEEVNKDGLVTNPRFQFPMASLPESSKVQLLGKTAGESLQIAEDGSQIRILEVYQPTARMREQQPAAQPQE
jgi:hypothetical protein